MKLCLKYSVKTSEYQYFVGKQQIFDDGYFSDNFENCSLDKSADITMHKKGDICDKKVFDKSVQDKTFSASNRMRGQSRRQDHLKESLPARANSLPPSPRLYNIQNNVYSPKNKTRNN